MSLALDLTAFALVAVGLAFVLVAGVGFTRLPDVFSRLHVTGILDTMGAPLMLLGIALWSAPASLLVSAKLVLALIFLLMTSPLIGHLLSRSALESMERERGPKVPTHTTADPEESAQAAARS